MNKHFFPIIYLPGPPPLGAFISAEELTHHYNAQRVITNANEKSALILAELEQKMASTRKDMRRVREQARQAGLGEAQEELDRLRKETIAQTVEWLITEDELERQIANHLDERIRALITQAMVSWLNERDVVNDLMQCVKQRLAQIADEELATLYIPPDTEDRVREHLSALPRVRIHTDVTLSAGQARLESRLAVVRFDLDAHCHLLLERLSRP